MATKLTVLCENTVEQTRPHGLLGEQGFACHISTPHGKYLFDTGNGLTILHNAEKLGIDLTDLSGIIVITSYSIHYTKLYEAPAFH